jgi:GDP-L-fucose synthase
MKVDLTNLEECREACEDRDIVFGLAARVAGIQYNQSHSADMFYVNSQIGLNMLEASRQADVERYLVVSSACVYPRDCSIPTPESEGFIVDPEPTNWGYGWAKRFLEVQAKAYASQYGMKIGIVRPYNTYGPRDHFSLEEAHVIPALIRRIVAGEDPLTVWGSGKQTRSFVYVTDLVRGMLLAVEKYSVPDAINVGSGEEVTIKELVQIISHEAGRKPVVLFDPTKPEGQLRRQPDLRKAKEILGFEHETSIEDGIRETVRWYLRERSEKDLAVIVGQN